MAEHEAYGGVTVDHLYPYCPALLKATRSTPFRHYWVGKRLAVEVDPEGTDLCGWCVRVWKARQAKS